MAYEKINQYTQLLKERYLAYGRKINIEEDAGTRHVLYGKQRECFECMLDYEQSILQMPKFKSQRLSMRSAIIEINPAFAKGYYKI